MGCKEGLARVFAIQVQVFLGAGTNKNRDKPIKHSTVRVSHS